MVKQLFISKDIDELSELPAFCQENNIKLIASSLIYFEPVPFILNSEFEVVFFSSIRAANFFLENANVPKGVEIACVGMTTAQKLIEKGLKISFIGNKSGLPDEVAQEFAEWLGERKVLIPCSRQSKRTISSHIPVSQWVEIEVYQTLSNCESIPLSDYYIFTSPSNFVSFLSCNTKPQGEIIAWGTTTKKALLAEGLNASFTLKNSNEKELIEIIQSNF
jgi:uroporphyrinogen-III synthase